MTVFVAIAQAIAARLDREERGAAAVEYGLLVALIAVVIITAVTLLGSSLNAIYCDIVNGIAGAGTCTP